MIFDWIRKKPELAVEVLGEDIVVTLPGTSCRVVYTKGRDNKLVTSTFRHSRCRISIEGSPSRSSSPWHGRLPTRKQRTWAGSREGGRQRYLN